MSDGDTTMPNRARLFLPVLALAATGIAVIVLSGSLGAATSGRSFLSHWFGPPGTEKSVQGQTSDSLTTTSDLPTVAIRSGA
jgi:hypothetical protein